MALHAINRSRIRVRVRVRVGVRVTVRVTVMVRVRVRVRVSMQCHRRIGLMPRINVGPTNTRPGGARPPNGI